MQTFDRTGGSQTGPNPTSKAFFFRIVEKDERPTATTLCQTDCHKNPTLNGKGSRSDQGKSHPGFCLRKFFLPASTLYRAGNGSRPTKRLDHTENGEAQDRGSKPAGCSCSSGRSKPFPANLTAGCRQRVEKSSENYRCQPGDQPGELPGRYQRN